MMVNKDKQANGKKQFFANVLIFHLFELFCGVT